MFSDKSKYKKRVIISVKIINKLNVLQRDQDK